MCQDVDGFMWFATETGLSRYDGTHFKNFDTKDGLPDNEVLKIFADNRGRVWIATFSKYLCYYFQGKIHTRENDSMLAKLNFNNNIVTIAEDDQGNVAFCDLSNIIWVITADDSVRSVDVKDKANGSPLKFIAVYSMQHDHHEKIIFSINQSNYLYSNDSLEFYYGAAKEFYFSQNDYVPVYRNPATHSQKKIRLNFHPINIFYVNSALKFIVSASGCYAVDTLNNKLSTRFLPDKKISSVLEDYEGNTWFSTLSDGVFKLPSLQFRAYFFSSSKGNSEVFSLGKSGNDILMGGAYSILHKLKDSRITSLDFTPRLQLAETRTTTNRLTSICPLSVGGVVLGFDSYIIKVENGKTVVNPIPAVKSICEIDKKKVLVGTARGAFVLSVNDMKLLDTIWNSRCTKVAYQKGKIYIGTLNGLFEIKKDTSSYFLGNIHPSLTRRITDIAVTKDSVFWIVTHDRGIIALKNDKVVAEITDENGLSSNNCKTAFLQNNYLWVGTNKGINKIDISDPHFPIVHFSVSDGLVSDIINAIYVEDSLVYAGTAAGLSVFNEKHIYSNSKCVLKILSIKVAGKELPDTTINKIAYDENNISFNFVGISFKSDGNITYQYRLDGLDKSNEWQNTHQTTISYPTLPAGDYTFNLVAVNNFGVQSNPYSLSFTIATAWWKSIWFGAFMAVLLTFLVWYITSLRYKVLTSRIEEKLDFRQRIADLEQLALRAQMNPHFIFNCLNSIQNFIINGDLLATNRYMNSFSMLLRQTLEHSSRKVISVAEEIAYISTYLELEKMRFGDQFNYSIKIDESIPADFTFIPTMILQPFIENSIRHGILYRKSGGGLLEIDFIETQDDLIVTIKDNGIGRTNSLSNKTEQHIEYHSKGMELTFKRLELLGEEKKQKVTTFITDIDEMNKEYPGTLVKIIFPIGIIDKLNKLR